MGTKQPQHMLNRKGVKGVCALWAVLLSAFLLTGCGTLDTLLQQGGNTKSTLGNWIGTEPAAPSVQNPEPSGGGKVIDLYFADSSGKHLVKEERTIPNTLSLARETVKQWLQGPAEKGSGSQAATPPGTALLDIAIKGGTAVVDLSGEFCRSYSQVDPEVTLYGLADTLTQFPTVKDVQIQVEGKPLTQLGNVSVGDLQFNGSLVGGPVNTGNPAATGNSSSPSDSSSPSSSGSPSNPNDSSSTSNKTNLSPSTLNLFAAPISPT